ncbi:TIM-barrel domain-containing protein [Caminicella sporogenes]|uniref:TIM-barrel domain-containing protein n=1 Tax=Caminicella sporogenes TaxID=166485 RepID=UPI00253FBF29|nr:TIM-barrel domain-containing protein [Caminicella sporogenes]WIF94911.1 glycoside hydrolase family 31 protein [Caminicella sporogenes]
MKVYEINEKVLKYRFGNPIKTDAVLMEGLEIKKSKIDYFEVIKGNIVIFKYKMSLEDIILGLGENLRGINKRGGIYESFCTDNPRHTPDVKSLYGAHNFIIIDGREKFGIFVDYPSKVVFDIGFTNRDYLQIEVSDNNFDFYIIKGDSSKEIVKTFLKLIGQSYVPPKWAFGFQQSRWSYKTADEIEEIAKKFIENDIPCDAIYLDIDYMEDFKDFTVSKERFPNFKKFVEDMRTKGFRLIPIIDAGVKIEEDYDIYEEGIEKGLFCTDEKGNPFVGAVWPGRVHFPDFLNPVARKWFGLKYKKLVDFGIEGFWNDMNEPAIFYSDRGLDKAIKKAEESESKNLDIYTFFDLKDEFINLSNNIDDYKSFYHKIDGKIVNHYKVHNLYGYNMTRAAAEGLEEISPNKRFLLFSRASYIGMHRYAGIWTGDNHSWWEHLLLNIKMMPSINMCGFLYSGADTGGFGGNANAELIIRWSQFSVFTPLFRNHSALGTRNQEPFAFDENTTKILRNIIRLRYALIPYIYSEFMKAVKDGGVYFSPLVFEYDDDISRRVEDQLLVGESIMLAPIYQENSKGRYVWLPEDMLLWKVRDYTDRNFEIIKKGHNYINVELDEIPIFIRKDKMIIIGKHGKNVESIKNTKLDVLAFIENKCLYVYYDDDGKTCDYKDGKYDEIHIYIEKVKDDFKIEIDNRGNKDIKLINFYIVGTNGKIIKKKVEIN